VYECDKLKNTMFGTEGGSRGPTHNFQIEVPPRFNNRDFFFFCGSIYCYPYTHRVCNLYCGIEVSNLVRLIHLNCSIKI
jgi:hypothetical protein